MKLAIDASNIKAGGGIVYLQNLLQYADPYIHDIQKVGYEIINLGNDSPVVLSDAIRLIESSVGKDADIEYHNRHPADVLATWATVEKAYRILGWSPMTSFEDGVAKCVQWYQEHEALVRELWE